MIKTQTDRQNLIPAGQQVNRLGKYLYRHLDGAFKMKKSPNMCDVYVTLLYAIPVNLVKQYRLNEEQSKVNEMTLDLNITTYQNKVRVNIIELTPEERTLGFDVFTPEQLQDPNTALKLVYNKVKQRVSKAYEDWDFLF